MSGLALFFRDHLQSEADTNDYSTSLRDCETKPAQSQSFEENTALSQFAEKGDYEKWRDSRDNFLLCYFALRFSTHSDATEIEPASPRNQLTFPPDETDSPRLETQNNIFSAETEQHSPHENIRIVIPDVRETHHHAERIRDIDLLAKSVTLLLCKAEKRFAFRQSQRAQFTCGTVPHPMYIHTGTSMANLPRLTLGGFQEDGPLRSYYKTVVNFEMKQVQDDISLLRQRAEYLEEDHIRAERIHVFFYGKYAETLDSILRSQQSHNLYFSIQNVPHRCVFPYPASGWYEAHDLSACCLGIGDWSAKMEVAGEEGNEVNHSFDHPDMRIFVATGSRLETIEHVSLLTPCRENGVTVENVEIENSPFFDLAEQFPLTVVSELDYDYYTISDLEAEYESFQSIHATDRNQQCLRDVMAVVVSFTPARQLKDWMMTLSLVDESIAPLSENEEPKPISMNIFGNSKDHFPHVRLAGDVIRMHRVEVKKFNGQIQLTGLKQSSFVVCRREQQSEDVWEWIWAASQNTTATESEKEKMQQLWWWGQEHQRGHPSTPGEYRFTLANMRVPLDIVSPADAHGLRGDVSVMVTSVHSNPSRDLKGDVPRGFLRVWDGTGIPISDPNPICEENEDGDPPPEALARLAAICRKVGLDPTTQVTGRVVNVAIWEDAHWEQVKDLLPGSFVRLRHTREETKLIQGHQLNCLMVVNPTRGATHVTPIPDDCYEVVQLLKQHDARRGEERNRQSGILPFEEEETGNGDMRVPMQTTLFDSNSLQELLASFDDGIFTGRIFLQSLLPSLSSISSIDKILSMTDDGSYYYRFGLRIETETGDAADVIVLDPAAEIIVAMTAQMAKQRSAQALANLKSRLDDHVAWDCTVRSVMFEGTRMLLLVSLTERDFRI